MYCPNCDRDVESEVRVQPETYPVKGEDVTVQAHVRYCRCCGKDVWDDALDAKNLLDAFAIYRQKHHLLQPAEIRSIREQYQLSQVAFARVLGLGDKTIARYENGSLADAAQNNLIELMQDPDNFEKLLDRNEEKLSSQEVATARNAIDALRPRIVFSAVDYIYLRPNQQSPVQYSTVFIG